jgi:HJR/Mrr/RecB family endonuclease
MIYAICLLVFYAMYVVLWVTFVAPYKIIRWIYYKVSGWETVSPQEKGVSYEEAVAKSLKKKGYRNIKITPRSGDFGADIIATDKFGRKTCFQCKNYKGKVGIGAVQEIAAARKHYGCEKAVVVTNSTFTNAAKKLALSNDIDLFECYEALFY